MFPPMEVDGKEEYYLEPMNCPLHILVYKAASAPIESCRCAFEFGTVYRYQSQASFTALPAACRPRTTPHLFGTYEQMDGEIVRTLEFVLDLLRDYGLDDFYLDFDEPPAGGQNG